MSEEAAEAGRADEVGRLALKQGVTIGTAESLTSGRVGMRLGAAEQAGEWFAGGITAYLTSAKRSALGVTAEVVVSELAAQQMAAGCRSLLGCDLAVAVTGAGGPDPQDGQPAGTVCIALEDDDYEHVVRRRFDGPPEEVVAQTTRTALELLIARLRERADA